MHCLQADTLPSLVVCHTHTAVYSSSNLCTAEYRCQPKPVPLFMGSVSNQTPEAVLATLL